MKKLFIEILICLSAITIYSQVPQKLNYQAVPRNLKGEPILNSQISLKMDLLKGGPNGTSIYSEFHQINTGPLGIVNIQIGGGQAISGSFKNIQWESADLWLKVGIDLDGGANFRTLSTLPFQAVPYAFYSENSLHAIGDSLNNLLDVKTDGAKPGQLLKWDGTNWIPQNDQVGADNWGTQFVQTDASLSGNGILSSPLKLSQQGANVNQVLKWTGTSWMPSDDHWGDQSVVTNATLSGNGTTGNSLKLAQQSATPGQVLKWNGTSWTPAMDNGQTYIPGNGIALSGDTIHSAWSTLGGIIYSNRIKDILSIVSSNSKEAKLNVIHNSNINGNPNVGILCNMTGDDASCREEFVGIKSIINSNCGYAGFFESKNYNSPRPTLYVLSNSNSAIRSILRDTNRLHNNTTAISAYNYNPSQNAIGVLGYHDDNGIGVFGKINGTAFTNVGAAEVAGVVGEVTNINPGSGSCGVKGLNRGTGLNGVGVQGAQFGNGWGVWGYVSGTNANGRAIYGQSSGELGYGGYFKGRVKIEKHPITASPYLEIPGSNWDIQNTDGDLKIGDPNYAFKIGVAIDGSGAGDCYLLAKGGTNRITLGQGNNTRVLTIWNGNVGIGSSYDSPIYDLQVTQDGLGLGLIRNGHEWNFYNNGAGNLQYYKNTVYKGSFNGVTGEYTYVSDVRLKNNLEALPSIMKKIMKLQAYSYGWNNDHSGQIRSIGFIAQDVEKHFPELVFQNQEENDYYSLNYSGFGILAVKAIQEQQIQIETQQKNIDELNKENEILKLKNNEILLRLATLEKVLNSLTQESHVVKDRN